MNPRKNCKIFLVLNKYNHWIFFLHLSVGKLANALSKEALARDSNLEMDETLENDEPLAKDEVEMKEELQQDLGDPSPQGAVCVDVSIDMKRISNEI